MRHRLPTLLIVAAIIAALLVPAMTAGATPTASPSSAQSGIEVRVPNFIFDPQIDGEPKLGNARRFDGQEAGFRLVQFYGPTKDAWLDGLQGAGLQVLQYYPHYTYLVWGAETALRSAERLDFVRWAGNFHPAYKINSDLVGREGVVQNADVFFFNDGDVKATLASLEALGAKVIQAYPAQPDQAFFVAVVELDASAFDAVSRLGTVLWLGYSHPEPVLDDEMSSQINAGNYSGAGVPFTGYQAWLTTLGYNGTGVTWATIDDGVYYDHPDFAGRIVGGYDFPGGCSVAGKPGSDCAGNGHGTHVTGIIGGTAAGAFADPNGFTYGQGVAPGYSIFAMNSLSAVAWPPAGGWQEHSKRALLGNAIGGNNSWTTGEGTAHGYQASERTHDLTVLDGNFDTTAIEPFIQVFSAGNSGPGANTLTAPKEAKNLIVVAASQNYRVGSINAIASFSSRGPSVDGRIVPTITTPGEQIASTRSANSPGACGTAITGANTLYSYCSGTSMAAPHASGAVALATQWWRGFNAGANPSPAMAKALLVNSAVDMGTADIPNFNEGWGRVNITNMIQPGVDVEYWDQTQVFASSGEQWTIRLGVADTSKPLKITLAWSDTPGAVGANPALVNNLDLAVLNGANTYRGNVFSGGWSATGGAADVLNNLENVYIQNPAGSATITINATNIAGDAVLGNADPTDQNFALICQNCFLSPDYTLAVTPTSQDICAPANAVYTVDVGSILGYTDPVTLSASGNPAGATAGFSVNPVTPAGSSTLTIGNTSAAAAGNYTVVVSGSSTTGAKDFSVGLNVFSTQPGAVTLVSPADGASNVAANPTFIWSAAAGAASYSIQVATDTAFSNVVASASGLNDPSWTSTVTLSPVTLYYWRVQANNACGIGANSAAWSFTTAAIVCNPGAIAIPSSGAASPYPSTIAVSGLVGQVTDVNVYLEDMNHTWPSDIDILLVGPQGQNIILMSDAGSSFDLVTVDLVFDDAAAGSLPVSAQITSGAYQPTNFGAGDPFPAPAPAPSAATALATFDGANPNGAWSLYVVDDTGGDQGSIAGGWCLEVGAQIPVEPPNIDVDPLSMSSTQPVNTTTQQTLDVGNTGEADLTWAIQEEPAQTVEAQKAPSISPTKLDAPAAVQRSAKALQDLLNSRMADAVLDAHGGSGAVCSNPGDVPWLSVSPTHGTTAPAATTAVDVTFDATGLAAGVYNANLCVSNNDPDPGPGNETDLVIVPVELTVLAEPSIVITKTVGTAPGVCATTREIDVAAGATVYYCYTVTNTGDATLNLHTLVDDQLGQLFTGFAYALTPGSSVSTVDAGLVFSAVIDELTTNVATWTAYDPQGRSATATATATVTVAPPTAVTLDSLNATPAAVAGSLALLALPAVVSLALGAAYALRRRAE